MSTTSKIKPSLLYFICSSGEDWSTPLGIINSAQSPGFGPLTVGMWLNREGMGKQRSSQLPCDSNRELTPNASFFFFPTEEELAMLFLLVYGSGRCLAPVTSEGWGLLIGLWQVQCHPKMLWTRITLDFVFKVFSRNILDIEVKNKHEICSFLMHFIHAAWRWFYLIFLVRLYVNHNLQYELRCRIFHLRCLISAQKVSETRFQIGDDWLELNCLDIWDRILGGSISGEMGKRHWGCGVPGGASSVVNLQCGRPPVCWTFSVVYLRCDRLSAW